jgi:hypothetical protein
MEESIIQTPMKWWEPWRDSFGLEPRPMQPFATIFVQDSKGEPATCRKCKKQKQRMMWTYHYQDVWGCECPGTVKALGKHPRPHRMID